jgi:hypothetical protein
MAAPSGVSSGVGFRHAQVLKLDENGIIYASGTAAYEGIQISGAKTLTLNDPEPRQIVHTGDDSVFALDTLPPQEPISGELMVGKQSDALDSMISDVNLVTVGESALFPIGTNRRGDEAQVALLAYRQAIDTDEASSTYGKRVWQLRLFPRCFVIPREAGFEDKAEERTYTIRPAYINQYPWGVKLSTSVENAVRAQGFRGDAEKKPKLVAFVADNTTTVFTLPVAASAPAKIKSWLVNTAGTGTVSTATTATTQTLTYTTAPTTGTLVVWYETN